MREKNTGLSGKKLLNSLQHIDMLIATIALGIMISVTFLDVIFRYVFNAPFTWVIDIQVMCLVWVIFLAGGDAFYSFSHVQVDVIVDRFPEKSKKFVDLFVFFITAAILIFMAVKTGAYVKQMMDIHRTTNILHIPKQYVYLAAPTSCIFMVAKFAVVTFNEIKRKDKKSDEEDML